MYALKNRNLDLKEAGRLRTGQLNDLGELRLDVYENLLIYKEKTKQWHDRRLKGPKEFNEGDRVLLFNSRLKLLPGKLKSRWAGPFEVVKVYLYGTIELRNSNGTTFKVNGHRVKKYFDGPLEIDDKVHVEPGPNFVCFLADLNVQGDHHNVRSRTSRQQQQEEEREHEERTNPRFG
ncbi:uncharacterized protein [Rutidosis leptorrhynchoides]|uniref:uncharacterized protein n=1 Tax=Rutidosis leptorrhynchoides TaxID=125765 RepID=UPI003A9A3C91